MIGVKLKKAAIAVIIAAAHGLAGALVYRQRVLSDAALWNSDLLVFALPAVVAFIAFTLVFWPASDRGTSPGAGSRVRAIAMAAVSTAVSAWAYCAIAFTRYGT